MQDKHRDEDDDDDDDDWILDTGKSSRQQPRFQEDTDSRPETSSFNTVTEADSNQSTPEIRREFRDGQPEQTANGHRPGRVQKRPTWTNDYVLE